ncbi:MAG: lamin tail domain-containing protein [Myxococcota bacterium]
MTRSSRLAGLVLSLVLGAVLHPAPALGTPLLLSEVLYDATGADDGKVFVELFGPSGFDLGGFTLEGVNGADGRVGPVLPLSGLIPGDRFFVVADVASGVTGVANADLMLDFDLQNGPDSVVLRDPAGSVVDALGYGSFAAGEIFAGEGNPAADPSAGSSVARVFANLDSDDNQVDFQSQSLPTPGFGPVAIPEPDSAWLLVAGCLCASALRRRSPRESRSPGL